MDGRVAERIQVHEPVPFPGTGFLLYGRERRNMTIRRDGQGGFTLLEVLIAAVVIVVLVLAFIGGIVASFMADASSHNTNASVNVARRTTEEVLELSFGDILALDGDTILTVEGLAVRISVVHSAVNLALIEVCVCRPVPMLTVGEFQALSLDDFKRLTSAPGSVFSLVTMKHRG